jgi:hypothetical protein
MSYTLFARLKQQRDHPGAPDWDKDYWTVPEAPQKEAAQPAPELDLLSRLVNENARLRRDNAALLAELEALRRLQAFDRLEPLDALEAGR